MSDGAAGSPGSVYAVGLLSVSHQEFTQKTRKWSDSGDFYLLLLFHVVYNNELAYVKVM